MPSHARGRSEDDIRTQSRLAKQWPYFGVAVLTYLTCVVFYPVLNFEFVGGDVRSQILENPYVHGLTVDNLKHILSSRSITSYYPVRTLSQAVDYQVWGPNPRGFKVTNVLIHLANVLLVFWLIVRLLRHFSQDRSRNAWWNAAVATFAAGIFAVHPVVVEPVVWVAGREELLMTLGALGSIHFHITAGHLAQKGDRWAGIACRIGTGVCCAVACLSNAVAAVIPLLIVAWDVLMLSRPRFWRIVRSTAALWCMSVVTIVIKLSGQPAVAYDQPEMLLSERLMLVLYVYGLNLKTVFWPADLGFGYPKVSPETLLDAGVVLGGMAVALTCAILWLLRRQKAAVFCIAWFGVALVPSSQIFAHHIQRADRFLYLPLVGLAAAAAMALAPLEQKLLRHRATITTAMIAGILGLIALERLAAVQVWTWKNELIACENTLKLAPNDATNLCAFADRLAVSGQFSRALKTYQHALHLHPDDERILANCAWLLATCDDRELRNDEKASEVMLQIATLLATHREEALRRPDEAVRLAERACQLTEHPNGHQVGMLAEIYAQTGRIDEAIAALKQAIEAAQDDLDLTGAEELRRRLERCESRASSAGSHEGGASQLP